MKVLFSSTVGSGHVRPLVPFMREMASRGHDIRLVAPEQLRELANSVSVSFTPVPGPSNADIQEVWNRRHALPKEQFARYAVQEKFARLRAVPALPSLINECKAWAPQLIVREEAEFAAPVAAELCSIPTVRLETQNSPAVKWFLDYGAVPVDEMRQSVGLVPDKGASLQSEPCFSAFPSSFDPTKDGSSRREPFRFRTAPSAPNKSLERPEWAPENRWPTIYITFGTEAGGEEYQREVYRLTLEAVAELPVNALLTTGGKMDASLLGGIPANVTVQGFVPQAEITPWISAIVFHGGSGTLLGALASGLPMVIIPLMADQFSNATSAQDANVGIAVLDRSASTIKEAVRRVLEDGNFAKSGDVIAAEIEAMDSLGEATTLMLKHAL